ncbi:MAG: zinc-dependent metalloprotease [Gemmatimonadaceae bacterium]
MRPSLTLTSATAAIIAIGCASSNRPAQTPAPVTPAPVARTTPQNPDDPETPAPVGRGGRGGAGGAAGTAAAAANPQPYNRVVTAQAQTKTGMFKVHKIGDRVLFEIPRRELNKDILLLQEIAETAVGAGYDGAPAGNRMVHFERRDNRVFLRGISNEIMASDTTSPVAGAVAASNVHPILAVFNVEAYGPDSAPVIDVTRLFTQPPTELSPAARIGAGYTIDATRSWIEHVASFPDNVNVASTLTLQSAAAGRGGAAAGGGGGRAGGAGFSAPTATIVASYSFHKLPETPMEPRLCDNRVGYFSLTVTDYAGDDQRMASNQRCFITRYRLEKKDPNAAISDPVKPIVYYLDANTPMKWRPYLKKAIEDWQPAFEAAGFSHAIIAKDAPTNDPDWSPEDARYSVVRWLPSTTENASGPNIHDPRSGEILNAHIQFYHNVQNLARTWYFTQAAANDPRARTFPFPDSLMGRLLEYVLAHEVGHTIGFQHNMKASSMYPIDSLRNADFLRRMGHVSTLMDYSRFNYIVQPEDHIAPELLIPKIGPYDIWATHWGYAPIATPMTVAQQGSTRTGAELIKAAESKEATLDRWAREQDTKPWLRFSTSGAFGSDPGDETEAVGDADPVKATELGIRNLKRNMQWIQTASVKPLEDYEVMGELYNREVGQWRTELGHVANLVGGMNSQEKYGDQSGVRFTSVPKAKQQAAVKFISEQAFQTPTWLVDQDMLRKMEPTGEITRIVTAQSSLIASLLGDAKLTRLIESEAMAKNPSDVYTFAEMLSDLRHGVFTEVYASGPLKIDVYRRGLQRAYLKDVGDKINPPAVAAGAAGRGGGGGGGRGGAAPAVNTGEIKAMLRGELTQLDGELASAQKRATDVATKRHIADARHQISDIVKPKGSASGGASADEGDGLSAKKPFDLWRF